MAIALIDGDQSWPKSVGHAVLPSTPATPHTLFYTGSNTRSLIAAALPLLIDGSSDYSDVTKTKAISLLREGFVLGDEWNTNHITVDDALSHQTGYPCHDPAVTGSARDSMRNLRNLPMSAEPRAKYQYCNKMYGAVGYLIETSTSFRLGGFHSHPWGPMESSETYLGPRNAQGSGFFLADEYYYYNSTGCEGKQARRQYMEKCAQIIYPSLPEPPLPPALPLANYTGECRNATTERGLSSFTAMTITITNLPTHHQKGGHNANSALSRDNPCVRCG
ncbi:hypothetical protein DL765_009616 [Monosporascus sp. GIB2]|nr:hypothetical protein DL765_009616 [Monosporascus sp. GIB2]